MRFFLSALLVVWFGPIGSATAATISPTQGLYVNVTSPDAFDGLEVLFTSTPSLANQLTFSLYSDQDLGGSLLGSTTLPFASGGGAGGVFVHGPDLDGVASVLAMTQFGTVDLSFRSGFPEWDSLTCTTPTSCLNDFTYDAAPDLLNQTSVSLTPVPLPAALPALLVSLLAFLGLKAGGRRARYL